MTHKSNKFKSITKGLIGPNIIFSAAYILFSAKSCPGLSLGEGGSIAAIKQVNKGNQLENIGGARDDHVAALLGRGTLLNLGDYLCGVFVPSDTKEVFIIKLNSKDGWMQLLQQGTQTDRLRLCYNAAPDPRIIKVDYGLFERLRGPLDQSPDVAHSSDKEDFWRKIEKDASWREIEFSYGKALISDGAIFRADDITSATEFTKELYKKFSIPAVGTTTLVSSKLSIRGDVASATLSGLQKTGFLLVKDANSLVDLVKNMLESDAEWGTKAGVVDTKAYITCPASVIDDALQFDGYDLDLQAQDGYSSVWLEGYASAYCYLNDGPYYRLIPLDNVKSFVKIDKAFASPSYYQAGQVYNTTPTKPLVGTDEAEDKAEANGIDGEQVDPITNIPEGEVTQPGNPNQRVHTSPMGYTGNPAKQTAHVTTNESAEVLPPSPQPVPPSVPNTNGLIPPAPPLPPMSNNVIPPAPPLPISSDPGVSSKSAGSPPPPLISNINKAIPSAPSVIKQANGQAKSSGMSMIDELAQRLNKRKQDQENQQGPAELPIIMEGDESKIQESLKKINYGDDNSTISNLVRKILHSPNKYNKCNVPVCNNTHYKSTYWYIQYR